MFNGADVNGLKVCLNNINELMSSEKRPDAETMIRPFIGKDLTGGYQLFEKNGRFYLSHPDGSIIE